MSPEQKPLVLIADDYQDTRLIVGEILEDAGYRVAEAQNGVEAVEKATSLLPDVVLMDLSLPQLDGWEAIRRLRADPRTSKLAIIALTAHALDPHLRRAREAGSDAVVTKPCDPGTLLLQIELVITKKAGEQRGASHGQA